MRKQSRCLRGLVAGVWLAMAATSAVAQQDLVPEARQVLHGHAATVRRMPRVAQEALTDWLREWPTLKDAGRKAVVDLLERLRYVPGDAVTQALRDVGRDRRRQALVDLASDEGFFRDEPTRALVVIAGVGAPSEVTTGGDARQFLRRTWGHVRRKGLLLTDVRVTDRNRSHPKWAATLVSGRFDAVGPDGRPRIPTLFETVRRSRGLPRSAVWLVTSGSLFGRADYSMHAEFGKELGALPVSSELFRLVARRRAAYVERSVREGTRRNVAEGRARGLSAEQLGLDERYPDGSVRAFVWDRMERERGVGIRNTFIYITAYKALQQYHPALMVVCFGEPGEEFKTPPAKPRRGDGRSRADYENALRGWRASVERWREALPGRRQEALTDLDLYVDYLYREFERNPYYGPRGMFVLVLGDPGRGDVQAVIVGPKTRAGASVARRYGLDHLAPTVAKFLKVPLPQATRAPIAEVFTPPADAQPPRPTSGSTR